MLTAKELLGRAQALEPQLVEWRRTLHRHPEVGFDLTQTKALVKKALTEMGYEPKDCGKAGVIALAGGKKPGKTILLRGDMDALPIQEESGVDYASEVPGKMHGCGHDMHTAMMLGAAKLLKEHEDEIEGTIKLEFQPAEEIFQGSLDMLKNGLLENPKVDAAVMFHVLAGMPLPVGTVLVPGGGITMASCEQYHITYTARAAMAPCPTPASTPSPQRPTSTLPCRRSTAVSWTPPSLACSPRAGLKLARHPTSSRILPICGALSARWTPKVP